MKRKRKAKLGKKYQSMSDEELKHIAGGKFRAEAQAPRKGKIIKSTEKAAEASDSKFAAASPDIQKG